MKSIRWLSDRLRLPKKWVWQRAAPPTSHQYWSHEHSSSHLALAFSQMSSFSGVVSSGKRAPSGDCQCGFARLRPTGMTSGKGVTLPRIEFTSEYSTRAMTLVATSSPFLRNHNALTSGHPGLNAMDSAQTRKWSLLSIA